MNDKILSVYNKNNQYDISCLYQDGAGDLIVFIHGLGCSKEIFSRVFSHPLYAEKSILCFDLAGFGRSSKSDKISYLLDDHADICREVINKFTDGCFHLAGHSMGGAIALLLSENILERLKTFANIEGNLIGDDCFISRKAIKRSLDVFEKKYFKKLKNNLNDYYLQAGLENCSPLAFYASSKSLVEWSDSGKLLDKFISLKCRKAYFYGEENSHMKVSGMIEDIEKIGIRKSGHFMMIDNPDEFYRKLYDFQVAF